MDIGNILTLENRIIDAIKFYYDALLLFEKVEWKTYIA